MMNTVTNTAVWPKPSEDYLRGFIWTNATSVNAGFLGVRPHSHRIAACAVGAPPGAHPCLYYAYVCVCVRALDEYLQTPRMA